MNFKNILQTHRIYLCCALLGACTAANFSVAAQDVGTASSTVLHFDNQVGSASGSSTITSVSADFGSRLGGAAVAHDLFGYGRAESIRNSTDHKMIGAAGVTVARMYAQIPQVYATETPYWNKIDFLLRRIRDAGTQKVMLQMSYSPPWLATQCGTNTGYIQEAAPKDVNRWAQIAASYVAHIDANFPGLVEEYEIWNEPNLGALCTPDRLGMYQNIYAAAAPAMKAQAKADGVIIKIGGPATAGVPQDFFQALLSNPLTAPYVDFVSYHYYLGGGNILHSDWNTIYQLTQNSSSGPAAYYRYAYHWTSTGHQPGGKSTPILITEFNIDYDFAASCCQNDPVYSPVWNSLYIGDVLNSVYAGLPAPGKLMYFAGNAAPYFCLIGQMDAQRDCLYPWNGTTQPVAYPSYFAYQLIASNTYLGLQGGAHMAKSVSTAPAGLAITAFYTGVDAIVITNPTGSSYSQVAVTFQNSGFGSARGTLYHIVKGTSITSTAVGLNQSGSNYSVSIDIPPYSVQAIAVKP